MCCKNILLFFEKKQYKKMLERVKLLGHVWQRLWTGVGGLLTFDVI
jgi:hypothetical protein